MGQILFICSYRQEYIFWQSLSECFCIRRLYANARNLLVSLHHLKFVYIYIYISVILDVISTLLNVVSVSAPQHCPPFCVGDIARPLYWPAGRGETGHASITAQYLPDAGRRRQWRSVCWWSNVLCYLMLCPGHHNTTIMTHLYGKQRTTWQGITR